MATQPTTTQSEQKCLPEATNNGPVESPSGRTHVRVDGSKIELTLYYQVNHHTPHEFHVQRSTATSKFWVMNATDLVVCVHDDQVEAERCANGVGCPRRTH